MKYDVRKDEMYPVYWLYETTDTDPNGVDIPPYLLEEFLDALTKMYEIRDKLAYYYKSPYSTKT